MNKLARLSFGLCAVLTAYVASTMRAEADDKTTLVVMIRGLDNPYHADYAKGAKALGAKLGLPVDVLSSEGNSQKQFSDLRAEIAKTGANMVVNIDPNQAPDMVPIARMLNSAGIYWVSWWNKPDAVKVESYPHWVAHIGFDAVGQGYINAKELFASFKTPYHGNIIAIQGMLSNNAAIDRFKGLQKALKEYPGVKLLQWEAADWDTNKAYGVTKQLLSAYPGKVDGIWSANDNMAIGAIAALKENNLAGKVLVSGSDGIPDAFEDIKNGTMVSTQYDDARYQAELGLSMALAAKEGKLDVSKIPDKDRAFLIPGTQVDKTNVDAVITATKIMPDYDLSNFYAKWVAAIN